MGLFDESDSDETDGTHTAVANGGGVDDDEEDPLEAYMKSLDAESATTPKTASSGGGRLDVDAEDEATSHWDIKQPNKKSSGDANGRLLPKYESVEEEDSFGGSNKFQAQARSAMSNTFVRAGGSKGQTTSKDTGGAAGDDDEDDFDNLQKVRKRQQQMLHQEVEPLERIDHKKVRYDSFRRVFYTPSDTEAGHAWRKEHEVVCTPSSFDPILGFGELGSGGGDDQDGAVFPRSL